MEKIFSTMCILRNDSRTDRKYCAQPQRCYHRVTHLATFVKKSVYRMNVEFLECGKIERRVEIVAFECSQQSVDKSTPVAGLGNLREVNA